VGAVIPGIVVPPEESFNGLVGLAVTDCDEHSARAELAVRRELLQPWGIVHGGVYATIAESLASWATATVVVAAGQAAMGLSNATSFLRPVSAGTIHALATRRHRGRTTWVWDVDMSDDEGRLCATSRVTIAVRTFERATAAGADDGGASASAGVASAGAGDVSAGAGDQPR
jgi:1,4-dihydroxy-2-naphthoyl-CoA hydrolase